MGYLDTKVVISPSTVTPNESPVSCNQVWYHTLLSQNHKCGFGISWRFPVFNQLQSLIPCNKVSLFQRLPPLIWRSHIHRSTTLGYRMVSLFQRLPPLIWRSHIHSSTTLGYRMVSLFQRLPPFGDHTYTAVLHWDTEWCPYDEGFLNSKVLREFHSTSSYAV